MIRTAAMETSAGGLDDPHARFDAFACTLAERMQTRAPERIRAEFALGCWIHGAGVYGRALAGLLQADGFGVLGFIDRRGGVELQTVMDLPVVHPDAFRPEDAQSRTFVGGVMNPTAASSDILAWVRSLPFAGAAIGADLPDALGEAAATCWQSTRGQIQQNLERLRAVFLQLGDRASQDTYLGLLNYRVTGEARHHPAVDADNQYLPLDLPGFDRPITFVDGGAYVGDTCEYLIRRGVEVRRYVAFEPDRHNYERLARFVSTAPIAEATLLPCGLSDQYRTVSFLDGQGVSSRIAGEDAQATTITCLSLDEALPGLRPDFVKMDVEGSELAALQGMVRTIESCHPHLALSLYHKPEDLWELPEWVGRHYARIYVRQHLGYGFETVLYALHD
jgi:FkbM family methyltransferase